MMAVIEITEANFEAEVLKSDVPVLVVSGLYGVDPVRCRDLLSTSWRKRYRA